MRLEPIISSVKVMRLNQFVQRAILIISKGSSDSFSKFAFINFYFFQPVILWCNGYFIYEIIFLNFFFNYWFGLIFWNFIFFKKFRFVLWTMMSECFMPFASFGITSVILPNPTYFIFLLTEVFFLLNDYLLLNNMELFFINLLFAQRQEVESRLTVLETAVLPVELPMCFLLRSIRYSKPFHFRDRETSYLWTNRPNYFKELFYWVQNWIRTNVVFINSEVL